MKITTEEVTVAVFIAKINMLRRTERMGESNAGIVRNGHMKSAMAGLRRLWTVLCVALVEISIKQIFQNQYTSVHQNTALRSRFYPHAEPGFAPTPGAKVYFTSF